MHYWQTIQEAYGGEGAFIPVVAAFLVFSFLMIFFDPSARGRVKAAVALFVLSMVGILAAAGMDDLHGQGLAYDLIRRISLIGQWIAIVTVGGMFLFDVLLKAIKIKPPAILCDLLLAFGYLAAAIAVLAKTGVDVSGIVATSAVVTAVIGFSLQDTLGNVMGGMALQLERTIRVGDWIRLDETIGVVSETRWRQTSIESRDGDTVVIPNSVLMKSSVVLLGRRRGQPMRRRRWVYFNVDYRWPPTDVIGAVEHALRDENIPGCASDPAPKCLLSDFTDSAGKYVVWYWATDPPKADVSDSIVRSRIWFGLQRAGIALAMPAARMFNVNDDEARKDRKEKEETARRIAALKCVALLAPLTDEERAELAAHLERTPFARGEHITRQGAVAEWMYILTKGEAEVSIQVAGHDAAKTVATIAPGDFVGEMGLMTGAPRSATVTATQDCVCYRLNKPGLDAILHRRPQIAESIAELLAARRVGLDAARENHTEEAKRLRVKTTKVDLLNRMRMFFGLEVG